jgi:tRNA (mo5U34)-methyltransferase
MRDVGALLPGVREFAERLNSMKSHAPEIGWYEYPTLSVFTILDRLLKGPHRDLRYLISSQPVLDLGCGDGDLTLLLSHWGCDVDAVDNPGTNANRMAGVRHLLEAVQSPARAYECDLDRLAALPRERYGLAFFLGVLYHLKNPFFALEHLAAHCEYALISTRVVEGDAPTAYLVTPGELNADPTNYWLLTPAGFERLLERAGFTVVASVREGAVGDADAGSRDGRMYVLARTARAAEVRLLEGWHAEEPAGFRWTGRRFAVALPAGVRRFRMRFVSTQEELRINGERFPGAGEHVYECSPTGHQVEMEVDRVFRPGAPDVRELGVAVATGSAFELTR